MPGFEQSIACEAHIGGFLAGLLGFSFFDPVRHSAANIDAPPPEPGSAFH
jgi:membrane associated rhomboid family serine protease